MKNVSVIIPTYNEEKVIGDCLESLKKQSYKDLEIIVVDDGSKDSSKFKTQNAKLQFKIQKLKLLEQNHKGPGEARNLGAKKASGEILVFVDADMTFDKDFIKNLVKPIIDGKTIGTFSKEEFVLNKDNVWSKCWNINKGLPIDRMHPKNYPDTQKVFRAILKKEFDKSGGFAPIGYIDDYTISEKLGVQAVASPGAIFYHRNPETLNEVFEQARWIGKSEYKRRKIKNEQLMRLVTMIRYSVMLSLMNGIYKSIKFKIPQFLVFKFTFDFAIEVSLMGSFFGEQKYK